MQPQQVYCRHHSCRDELVSANIIKKAIPLADIIIKQPKLKKRARFPRRTLFV